MDSQSGLMFDVIAAELATNTDLEERTSEVESLEFSTCVSLMMSR